MTIKNENDLRAAAAVLNRDMLGLCNSKTVEETTTLFDVICKELTSIYKYKVSVNEQKSN